MPGTSDKRLALLLAVAAVPLLGAYSCRIGFGDDPDEPSPATEFAGAERVFIEGWNGDAMEPFLTPDGQYLLFNSSNAPGAPTDLHYAEKVDATHFVHRGEITGANSAALDAVPSLDVSNRFYFISTRSYDQTLDSVYRGVFSGGVVSNVALVPGVSRDEPGILNFDAAISPDGETLYVVDGRYSGGSVPDTADIVIATRAGDAFRRRADSAEILRNVNSTALEYAPAISTDGLELYFTRVPVAAGAEPAIYVATRSGPASAFGTPRRVAAATGFVEAPALSLDGRALYFHRREGDRFVIWRATR